MLEVVLDVNAGNSPLVLHLVVVVWNFESISSGDGVLLVHIGEGKPHPGLPVLDADLEMHAEVFLRHRHELDVQLYLPKMYVSANQIGVPDLAVGIGDGDGVVGQDGTRQFESFSGDDGVLDGEEGT